MQARRSSVWFGEPNFASSKVGEERGKVYAWDFAGPDDTGVVNIRPVVNPLAVYVVVWLITNNNEVFAGSLLEFGDDAGTLPVVVIGQADFGVRSEDMLDKANR